MNLNNQNKKDCQRKTEEALLNEESDQNDRLVAYLIGFMLISVRFISKWIPIQKLIEGVKNPYLSQADSSIIKP